MTNGVLSLALYTKTRGDGTMVSCIEKLIVRAADNNYCIYYSYSVRLNEADVVSKQQAVAVTIWPLLQYCQASTHRGFGG